MSKHPSLKISGIGLQHRNVLKRNERVKFMIEKNKLKEDASMFGLPKIKRIRLKIKKEKAEETPKTTTEAIPAATAETKTQQGQQQPATKEKK